MHVGIYLRKSPDLIVVNIALTPRLYRINLGLRNHNQWGTHIQYRKVSIATLVASSLLSQHVIKCRVTTFSPYSTVEKRRWEPFHRFYDVACNIGPRRGKWMPPFRFRRRSRGPYVDLINEKVQLKTGIYQVIWW